MTKSGAAREAGGESTHRRAALALAVGMLAVLVGCDPARAAPRTWHVDTSQSQLVVHVFRKGLLSPVLHDHHFVPERWSASVTFDPDRPQEVEVRLTVATDSLRDRQPALSQSDIQKVEGQVRGSKVLDAGRYPVIRLTADRLEVSQPSPGSGGRGCRAGRARRRARPPRTHADRPHPDSRALVVRVTGCRRRSVLQAE